MLNPLCVEPIWQSNERTLYPTPNGTKHLRGDRTNCHSGVLGKQYVHFARAGFCIQRE